MEHLIDRDVRLFRQPGPGRELAGHHKMGLGILLVAQWISDE
jgi:hypothetical protein